MKHNIPQNAEKGACRKCGETVFLVETRPGRRTPVDPDGYPHFARCAANAYEPNGIEEATHA